MQSEHESLLRDLTGESLYLRQEAMQSVQNGMDELVASKRLLQKITLNEQELENTGIAVAELLIAGNALRMALETIQAHHQRIETPWVDEDGGIHLILRNSIEFEKNVEAFISLIHEAMQERRKNERR